MDLTKMKDDKKLELCRWYFRENVSTNWKVGFAFLPFLWAVNTVWFFKEAFQRPPYDEQLQIRKYVILSGLGCIIWLAVITSWTVIFQTNRARWGELGDRLSFIIPTGIP